MSGDFGKALSVWDALAPEGIDLAEHQGRTIAQKSLYLAQELGVDCGYDFTYNIRGVWSKGLNDDIFAILRETWVPP